jgi:osmotically-inducible protein OsmY
MRDAVLAVAACLALYGFACSRPSAETEFAVKRQAGPAVQSQSEADLALKKRIETLLAADKSLSAQAKSVRIVTNAGQVGLHGTAASEAERRSLEAKVQLIAGLDKVSSEVRVPGD